MSLGGKELCYGNHRDCRGSHLTGNWILYIVYRILHPMMGNDHPKV